MWNVLTQGRKDDIFKPTILTNPVKPIEGGFPHEKVPCYGCGSDNESEHCGCRQRREVRNDVQHGRL